MNWKIVSGWVAIVAIVLTVFFSLDGRINKLEDIVSKLEILILGPRQEKSDMIDENKKIDRFFGDTY